MKTTPTTTLILTLMAALFALASCSDFDNGYTEQQLNYIRSFREIYGDIDHTQDWNFAERASVTVTTTSPSDIKVYASCDGRYTLVAHYKGVSGTQTLAFDVVEGTSDVLVSDGQMAHKTKVGGCVEFGMGTRTVHTTGENERGDDITVSLIPEGGITLEVDGTETHFPQYKSVTKDVYNVFLNELPEIGGMGNEGYRKWTNFNKVENNFQYTSTGKFIIYPYYFVTTEKDEIGLYYMNGEEKVEVPIYTMAGELEYQPKGKEYWVAVPGNSEEMFGNDEKVEAVRSRGIVIDIPVGKVFGMYLKQYGRYLNAIPPKGDPSYESLYVEGKSPYDIGGKDGNENVVYESDARYTLYSHSKRNDDPYKHGYGIREEGGEVVEDNTLKPCYAATFEAGGQMFLAFEDWSNRYGWRPEDWDKGSDFDFNDLVFAFDGAAPITIPEDEVQSWIISAEDLGNTYDIDYNDVVVEVQYASGQTKANIIPLAAGGTLPSEIYFDDKRLGEIHELLGGKKDEKTGLYTPINVWGKTPEKKYEGSTDNPNIYNDLNIYDKGILVDVSETFSLATSRVGVNFDKDDAPNMGGFKIKVTYPGEEGEKPQTIQNSEETGQDNVPYVICTPKTYKDSEGKMQHYRWPQESIPMFPFGNFIAKASYNQTPNQNFIDWVKNKKNGTEWYKHPNPDTTCAPESW